VSEQPKTLTAADILGAIAGLAIMVDGGGGELEPKATLAATTFRVAARAMGNAWAEERVGPIVSHLREQAKAAGLGEAVERILHGIPQFPSTPRAGQLVAADVDALMANLRSVAEADALEPITDDDLAWVQKAATAVRDDPRASGEHVALAIMAVRLVNEVRRLRAEREMAPLAHRPS
jgi:hypothetical protein